MKTVWFNQGYASVREGVIRVREGGGASVRVVASHRNPLFEALAVADLALEEPDFPPEDAGYLHWSLDICREHAIHLFVPQFGRHWLAPHTERFAAIGTRLSVPADQPTLRLIDDKARFHIAAAERGLPTAWTREIASVEAFDAALAELAGLGLAACVKPVEGTFGHGFWQLDPERSPFATLMNPETHRMAPALFRHVLVDPAFERLLVMQHLPGDEWSVDCVCRSGETVAAVARRKLDHVQRLETEGAAVELAARAVEAFGLSGLINVQFRAADAAGTDLRLLEINTRMSGGCFHTVHAGINLPWLHVATELGLPVEPPAPRGGALVGQTLDSRVIAHA